MLNKLSKTDSSILVDSKYRLKILKNKKDDIVAEIKNLQHYIKTINKSRMNTRVYENIKKANILKKTNLKSTSTTK